MKGSRCSEAMEFPHMPVACSNPHPGHVRHRAKFVAEYDGAKREVTVEWEIVEVKAYVK
ncbi:MAG TPA: hypothetical protein VNZ52_16945 [Candidatus Thermoplasmatota archaeon]|nr:hypothetical protein [Candidatus Thermoplasmatota archaeon]